MPQRCRLGGQKAFLCGGSEEVGGATAPATGVCGYATDDNTAVPPVGPQRLGVVTRRVRSDLAGMMPEEKMVGVRGFEPPAPASRRQCSTKLSYTPTVFKLYALRRNPLEPPRPVCTRCSGGSLDLPWPFRLHCVRGGEYRQSLRSFQWPRALHRYGPCRLRG